MSNWNICDFNSESDIMFIAFKGPQCPWRCRYSTHFWIRPLLMSSSSRLIVQERAESRTEGLNWTSVMDQRRNCFFSSLFTLALILPFRLFHCYRLSFNLQSQLSLKFAVSGDMSSQPQTVYQGRHGLCEMHSWSSEWAASLSPSWQCRTLLPNPNMEKEVGHVCSCGDSDACLKNTFNFEELNKIQMGDLYQKEI